MTKRILVAKQAAVRLAVLFGVLLALAAPGPAAAEGTYKVVVNHHNRQTSMSRKDLSAIFLRRRAQWPDGTTAWPVNLIESARARVDFTRDVHGRTVATVRNYWLQMLFSGRGVPPIEKATDQEVLDYVKSHPGAVGYVSVGAPTDEVKVLNLVDP
jgi:ABC-type phosphate transport system substrate-binding protein